MTDGANLDGVNKIYQCLLSFKNVMQFHKTHINGFTFMPAKKCCLTCTSFHETCKCSTALNVDILHNNKPKHIKDKLFI